MKSHSPIRTQEIFSSEQFEILRNKVTFVLNNPDRNKNDFPKFKVDYKNFISLINQDLDNGRLKPHALSLILLDFAVLLRYSKKNKSSKEIYDESQTTINKVVKQAFKNAIAKDSTWVEIAAYAEWLLVSRNILEKKYYQDSYPQELCNRIIALAENSNTISRSDLSRICHWLTLHPALNSHSIMGTTKAVNSMIAKISDRLDKFEVDYIVSYLLLLNFVPKNISEKVIEKIKMEVLHSDNTHFYYFSPNLCHFVGLYYQKENQDKEFILAWTETIRRNVININGTNNKKLVKNIGKVAAFFCAIHPTLKQIRSIRSAIYDCLVIVKNRIDEISVHEMKHICSFALELKNQKLGEFYKVEIKLLDEIKHAFNNKKWGNLNKSLHEKVTQNQLIELKNIESDNPYYFFYETESNVQLGKQFLENYFKNPANKHLCIDAHNSFALQATASHSLSIYYQEALVPNSLHFAILTINGRRICTVNLNSTMSNNGPLVDSLKNFIQEENKKVSDIYFEFIDPNDINTNLKKVLNTGKQEVCEERVFFDFFMQQSETKDVSIESVCKLKLYPKETTSLKRDISQDALIKPIPFPITYSDMLAESTDEQTQPYCRDCAEKKPEILTLLAQSAKRLNNHNDKKTEETSNRSKKRGSEYKYGDGSSHKKIKKSMDKSNSQSSDWQAIIYALKPSQKPEFDVICRKIIDYASNDLDLTATPEETGELARWLIESKPDLTSESAKPLVKVLNAQIMELNTTKDKHCHPTQLNYILTYLHALPYSSEYSDVFKKIMRIVVETVKERNDFLHREIANICLFTARYYSISCEKFEVNFISSLMKKTYLIISYNHFQHDIFCDYTNKVMAFYSSLNEINLNEIKTYFSNLIDCLENRKEGIDAIQIPFLQEFKRRLEKNRGHINYNNETARLEKLINHCQPSNSLVNTPSIETMKIDTPVPCATPQAPASPIDSPFIDEDLKGLSSQPIGDSPIYAPPTPSIIDMHTEHDPSKSSTLGLNYPAVDNENFEKNWEQISRSIPTQTFFANFLLALGPKKFDDELTQKTINISSVNKKP